mmetsp:Transcript_13812/g.25341  ORF Transcript_13812/g.25341 Transcript_13812/m.25341 type:complete len:86 (-) Transcript_13812:18-275(-)
MSTAPELPFKPRTVTTGSTTRAELGTEPSHWLSRLLATRRTVGGGLVPSDATSAHAIPTATGSLRLYMSEIQGSRGQFWASSPRS